MERSERLTSASLQSRRKPPTEAVFFVQILPNTMNITRLTQFRRAFRSHDWTTKQRRRYAEQWCASLRHLGPSWKGLPTNQRLTPKGA